MELMAKLKDKMIPWRRKAVEHRDVMNLRDDINRVFDRFFFLPLEGDGWTGRMWGWDEPVMETSEGIVVRVDVPGVDPKDLAVTVHDGVLHIQAEKEDEWGRKDDDRYGYRYGSFHRTVPLPDGLDTSRATATCKHGLMTVQIPWTTDAKQRSRRIVVNVE
jgi:HSP20 family protein